VCGSNTAWHFDTPTHWDLNTYIYSICICLKSFFSAYTAICSQGCFNSGTCIRPGVCSCTTGWTGYNCRTRKYSFTGCMKSYVVNTCHKCSRMQFLEILNYWMYTARMFHALLLIIFGGTVHLRNLNLNCLLSYDLAGACKALVKFTQTLRIIISSIILKFYVLSSIWLKVRCYGFHILKYWACVSWVNLLCFL